LVYTISKKDLYSAYRGEKVEYTAEELPGGEEVPDSDRMMAQILVDLTTADKDTT
jgi:hypothetical protein